MKNVFRPAALFLLLLFMGGFAQSQILQSCAQYANTSVNGYNVYNNIWGSGAGSQCMTVYSQSDWYIDANHSGSGIKSYPNSEKQLSVNVDDMGAITSTFSVTRPASGGSYSSTYDIWYNNYAYEIMLWMNYTGSVGPISYNYGCSGYPSTACPVATNVTVGGHTWNIYQGTNGSNTVYSFLRTSNTNSGTVDITAISKWLRNNGWFGNVNLHSVQFGFEITNTSGTQRFEVDSYAVNVGSSSSGTTYYQFKNRNTGLLLDGMGRTSNGSACGQYANTTHVNSQWQLVSQGGNYYQLRNRGTGLVLDGMGLTTNGSDCGQYANTTTHYNSHWEVVVYSGSYYRLRNRGTGLYLDGMGRTTNGANCGQWANTTHANAQWQMISVSGARLAEEEEQAEELSVALDIYPNPSSDWINIPLPKEDSEAIVKIFNTAGQLVLKAQINQTEHLLDIQKLEKGMYLVEVINGSNTQRTKLLKQ